MKNVILGLIVGIALGSFLFHQYSNRETVKPCGYGKEYIIENFQEWITNGIQEKDARIKDNPIKIVDVAGIFEYNSIPTLGNIDLYEDLKDSRVCKATMLVNFTPNNDKDNIEEIRVRFQKVNSSPDEGGNIYTNMSVSGYDFEEITKSALEYFRKHHKK